MTINMTSLSLSISLTHIPRELVASFVISYISMENGHDGSNSKGMCEKIFSCLCPNFQSNHHAHHKLANGSGAEAVANDMARVPKAEMVRPTRVYGQRQHHVIVSMDSQVEVDNKTPGLDKNDTFSEYINRTKFKIRASKSNVGKEKVASGEDHVKEKEKEDDGKDVFSDFVNRAKIKIRKTSSFGSKMNISFKN
ncbi:uncharacterized protein LOC112194829 [Rosa chinensis]|nr:uncharacterized protein LOC112194829 [Rosa chinensis]